MKIIILALTILFAAQSWGDDLIVDPFTPAKPDYKSYELKDVVSLTITLGQESATWVDGLGLITKKPEQITLRQDGAKILVFEQHKTKRIKAWFPMDPVGSPRICAFDIVLEDGSGEYFPVTECTAEDHPILFRLIQSYAPERFEEYKKEWQRFRSGPIIQGK